MTNFMAGVLGFLLTLQGLPTRIPAVDFMPPLDLGLSQLPTQVHDPPVHQVREVTEPDLEILHQHAQFLDLLKMLADEFERHEIMRAGIAAPSELGFGT